MAQVTALKEEDMKKKRIYSKQSKRTQRRRIQFRNKLASKGFLPVDEYIRLVDKKKNNVIDTLTPELDTIITVREESEESSDEATALAQDTCAYSSVSDVSESEAEPEECLPVHNAQLHLRHHARMESEESSGGDDDDGFGDYARPDMSNDKADEKETLTAIEHLEVLRHEVPACQEISEKVPGSTSQILGDHSKLREASARLTKEATRGDLDVIVRARIASMVGLLNIYTDESLGYSWIKASELVAKTQGRGANHARRIRKWSMGFLKSNDLPFHQLNWKRSTILDDEDIAEEIRARMMVKVTGGFLKAEDVVDIVAGPQMQAIFAQKGITKPTISIKTALRWLEKLGWTYGKLKTGMYLDGHERPDVVEYRKAFVERWMGHERRFHRWDHDGAELPRPNGFPVAGAIGRFRLILVTHDESTFFQNDERNTG